MDWDTNTNKLFEVDIKISVANKTGVLAKVTSMLSNQGIGIENASAETGDSNMYGVIYLTLLVENRINLAQIMKKLKTNRGSLQSKSTTLDSSINYLAIRSVHATCCFYYSLISLCS